MKNSSRVYIPFCITALIGNLQAATTATTLSADWETRTGACPGSITASTQYTLTLTNINDVVIDFTTGQKVQYTLRARKTPIAVVPPSNPFTGQIATATCPVDGAAIGQQIAAVKAAVAANPQLKPAQGVSVPVSVSLAAANSIPGVLALKAEIANSACAAIIPSDPAIDWVKSLDGTHSRSFTLDLEPNYAYTFTIDESWLGKTSDSMSWDCGNVDVFSLSTGPLLSTLPSRSYTSQSTPSPAGGTATQNVMVVSNSTLNTLAAGLLNVHFPPNWFGSWAGLAISAGPVYKLGDSSPSVSSLGVFAGLSVHLYRSFYLTPGIHIGQFADFPAGFYPNSPIPAGYGNLNSVNRTTAHFAIGITFKTTSFTKQNTNSSGATTPATTQPANNQPANNKTANGNAGTGK